MLDPESQFFLVHHYQAGSANTTQIWYEEMKKEAQRVIADIAQHTGYNLSEKDLDSLEEYTKFLLNH